MIAIHPKVHEKLLSNKRIFVTGASRGLGRSFCECFAKNGAKVAFNYSEDEEGSAETLRQIKAHGTEGLAYKVSVLNESDLNRVAAEVEKSWGGIDILVNNAGISQPLPIALMEESDWDSVMDVNVKGQFLATRAILRGMIRRRSGTILNIGSLAGIRLIEAPVHYSASKAAVKGFTEALSKEVARYNVRVNCLAPGLLEDGVGRNVPEHRLKDYLNNVSLGRLGRLEEVAKLAAFMVSDRNSYMNGATIVMDGGL